MSAERKGNSVKPIEPLIFKDREGNETKVEALGYGMMKPAISLMKTTKLSVRERTDIVAFTSEEFDEFYAYLTQVKEHWEQS